MRISGLGREEAKSFNAHLAEKMHAAEQAALMAVDSVKKAP